MTKRHWAFHDYSRRSVESVTRFEGWDYFKELIARANTYRDKGLIAALLKTGGRVSEVLNLETDMVKVRGDFILVEAMPVLKRYKKVGGTSVKLEVYRSFPIPIKEPLSEVFLEYVENREERLFKIGRKRVYQIITGLDVEIWPHWFRSQRASQLAGEYGFTVHDLVEWFNWKSLETAVHYARLGWRGLAEKMK